jgi:DNA-binding transcriptional MerR regulator
MCIGELAAATGVSVRSLRYYEEQDLLRADRSAGGQRLYEDDAVARVALIRQLFTAGLCGTTMARLLPRMSEPIARTPLLREPLERERARITDNIQSLRHTQDALDRVIRGLDQGRFPPAQ